MLSLWCVCVVIAYFGSGRDLADSEERVAERARQRALEWNSREYLLYFLNLFFSFFLFLSCHVYPLLLVTNY